MLRSVEELPVALLIISLGAALSRSSAFLKLPSQPLAVGQWDLPSLLGALWLSLPAFSHRLGLGTKDFVSPADRTSAHGVNSLEAELNWSGKSHTGGGETRGVSW